MLSFWVLKVKRSRVSASSLDASFSKAAIDLAIKREALELLSDQPSSLSFTLSDREHHSSHPNSWNWVRWCHQEHSRAGQEGDPVTKRWVQRHQIRRQFMNLTLLPTQEHTAAVKPALICAYVTLIGLFCIIACLMSVGIFYSLSKITYFTTKKKKTSRYLRSQIMWLDSIFILT